MDIDKIREKLGFLPSKKFFFTFADSVADPGCLSRFKNPGSNFFHPESRVDKIPDSAFKNLNIFNTKN
jgi:hypothetical protein